MKHPSDFTMNPWDSVTQDGDSETIARNIMVILKRTGDEWRRLPWEEYADQRRKDGNFTMMEKEHFDRVIGYTVSEDQAVKFSPAWAVTK